MLLEIISAFVTIFVILDPLASIPPFLMLTRKAKADDRTAIANKAIIIAAVIALIAILSGNTMLNAFGVSLGSFKVAGGIVLGLMGLETVMGLTFKKEGEKIDREGVAVLIATPLLTGPGMMSTLIVLTQKSGMIATGVAAAAALVIAWVILRSAHRVTQLVGQQAINVFSKIMGLILLALAIEFIKTGLLAAA